MDISILGPLEVRADDRAVPLGGVKPRALVAMLALHANQPVSAEHLARGLWGDDAPAGAVKTVQVHVSRLRKALGDPDVLTTTPAGYLLRVRPGELDAERFEELVADARRELSAGRAEPAGAVLRDALGLWRGAPLADLADHPFAPAEIARLEEQRLGAVELRVEADLAAGRHAELIAELERLTREHPWRERLHAQRMLALYRSGRQADALTAYRSAREVLVEELGIEPGTELRQLHQAVLDHDPSLDRPRAPTPRGALRARAGRPSRRRPAAVGAVVVAVLVAAALALRGGADAPEPVHVPPDSIAVIDPRTNTVVRAIRVDEAPGPISAGAGRLWVLNLHSETVSRIDPRNRRVLRTQGIGDTPGNVTASAEEVWVASTCTVGGAPGKLQHLYTARDGGVDTFGGDDVSLAGAVRGPPSDGRLLVSPSCALAARGATAWTATNLPPGIARVDYDPRAGQSHVTWGRRLPQPPIAVAVGAGSVWALDGTEEVVRRIDPARGRVVAEVRVGADPGAIAVGAGAVWVANRGDDSVSRIDPRTNAVSKAISVGDGPIALAAGADGVWVSTSDGSVMRIDPGTNRVTARIALGHRSEGIALAAGSVWVSVRS